MHEYVYADRILQTVIEYMKKEENQNQNQDQNQNQNQKVKLIHVKVGELLDLSSQSLNLAYSILSKGTIAEGSKLKVSIEKGSVLCTSCGFNGRLEVKGSHAVDPVFACPKCGSPLKIEKGNSVEITGME
ncbi:MAG: hydrogenase maturation nickel metallochaperone HypA [Conexivisphaerales archaeon]